MHALWSLAALAVGLTLPSLVKANDFAGANSYFLYALSVSRDITRVLVTALHWPG